MATNLSVIAVSPLFDRGKCSIPSIVRRKLGVKDGDRLVWMEDTVTMEIYVRANVAFKDQRGRYV